jgi:hypothetical protein
MTCVTYTPIRASIPCLRFSNRKGEWRKSKNATRPRMVEK